MRDTDSNLCNIPISPGSRLAIYPQKLLREEGLMFED
ncbi:uncharacterized protein J3R85_018682 [Psidium guajava]|nr:uncharacterized protein J3R85_018682 [Psidium guajava]